MALLLAALSVAIFLPLLRIFYWPAGHGLDVSGYQIGRDFINDWVGPRLAFSGRVLKLFDLRDYARLIGVEYGRPLPFHNWSYPPTTLLLLAPFSALPYGWALGTWTLVFFAAYLLAALKYISPDRRMAAAILLVAAPATLINVVGGQNGFVTGALLLGSLAILDRRPLLAGVLLGMLTTKPHLGLVVAFALLSLGAWRAIAAAVATALLLVLQSLILFGLEPWRLYLGVTSAYQVDLLREPAGFYIRMMASVLAMARLDGVSFQPACAVQAATSLAVVCASGWAVRKTSDPGLRALVITAATPLATPYAFNYDLTAMSGMLAWRLTSAAPLTSVRRMIYVLGWLSPTLMMTIGILKGAGLMAAPVVLAFVAALAEVAGRASSRVHRQAAPNEASAFFPPVSDAQSCSS